MAILAIFSYLLFVFSLRYGAIGLVAEEKSIFFPETNTSVKVELAVSAAERKRGLMNRKKLEKNKGMLFVFSSADRQSFWMKNTLIPLDLIFFDDNWRIVDIKKNFAPCVNNPCEIYSSAVPAKYVLEINAGLADKDGIKVGQPAEIK